MPDLFLPGVSADRVLAALKAAGGNEVESGKLLSPESGARLADDHEGRKLRVSCHPR